MTNMKRYRPRVKPVYAYQVTRENVQAVAREIGGEVSEEAKPGDPSDVAVWLITPLLSGVTRFLVTSEGPVVGYEVGTNRLVAWAKRRDFEAEYELVTRSTDEENRRTS